MVDERLSGSWCHEFGKNLDVEEVVSRQVV